MNNSENEENFQFHLPNGEILRTILVRPELTESNLKSILKSKGVFLSKYSKEHIIPPLMRSLLAPSEYNEIIELQKFKTERLKYRTTQIPWQGDRNILKSLPKIDLHNLIREKFVYDPGFDLLGVPSFVAVDGRDDKVALNFKVEEYSDIKTINNRKKEFEGSIEIELKEDGSLQLHTVKTFTSKATQDLVNSLEKKLEKHFKEIGSVKKEDSYERIMFNHFTNKHRFNFFMKFMDDLDFLKFKKIVDLNVRPDPEEELPKEAQEFLKDINNLNLKGNALRKHMLIADQKYRSCIWLISVMVQYEFEHAQGKGICEVEYAFPDFHKEEIDESEFQFFIGKILVNRNYKASAKKSVIEKAIFETVNSWKTYHYNDLKI
jgi:hypothetical protein